MTVKIVQKNAPVQKALNGTISLKQINPNHHLIEAGERKEELDKMRSRIAFSAVPAPISMFK